MVISQKLSINEILDGQKLVSAKGCRIFKPDSISSLKFMPYLKHFVCSFPLNIFYNPSDATSKQLVNIRPKKTISVWVYQRKNTCQGFFVFVFLFFFNIMKRKIFLEVCFPSIRSKVCTLAVDELYKQKKDP